MQWKREAYDQWSAVLISSMDWDHWACILSDVLRSSILESWIFLDLKWEKRNNHDLKKEILFMEETRRLEVSQFLRSVYPNEATDWLPLLEMKDVIGWFFKWTNKAISKQILNYFLSF